MLVWKLTTHNMLVPNVLILMSQRRWKVMGIVKSVSESLKRRRITEISQNQKEAFCLNLLWIWISCEEHKNQIKCSKVKKKLLKRTHYKKNTRLSFENATNTVEQIVSWVGIDLGSSTKLLNGLTFSQNRHEMQDICT